MSLTLRASNRSRASAIGLLIVAVIAIITPPMAALWWLHQRYDKALADSGDQLARYRRIIATREESEKTVATLRARQLERLYLKSSTPSAAAAEVQDMLRGHIESNGGRIVSIQPPVHREEGRYRLVTINVNMTANGPALRRILHAIESAKPHLVLDNIVIRQSIGQGYRLVPGIEPDLFVQFDVQGFALVSVQ